jgi:hypothetical protein
MTRRWRGQQGRPARAGLASPVGGLPPGGTGRLPPAAARGAPSSRVRFALVYVHVWTGGSATRDPASRLGLVISIPDLEIGSRSRLGRWREGLGGRAPGGMPPSGQQRLREVVPLGKTPRRPSEQHPSPGRRYRVAAGAGARPRSHRAPDLDEFRAPADAPSGRRTLSQSSMSSTIRHRTCSSSNRVEPARCSRRSHRARSGGGARRLGARGTQSSPWVRASSMFIPAGKCAAERGLTPRPPRRRDG